MYLSKKKKLMFDSVFECRKLLDPTIGLLVLGRNRFNLMFRFGWKKNRRLTGGFLPVRTTWDCIVFLSIILRFKAEWKPGLRLKLDMGPGPGLEALAAP